jgi:excisionase family DNA binding protein
VHVINKQSNALATPAEVADYLQVKEGTLAEWRYRKVGPSYIKVGHYVRYRRADVEAWLTANSMEAV